MENDAQTSVGDDLRARGWLAVVEGSTRGIGGFNIRENRNSPSRLSDHSFGWAIDIDPDLNPNIKQFPRALVEAFAGQDVFRGAAATAIRTGGDASAEGGGLKWLGAIERGTKDFMHFELRSGDHPQLPREEAKPPDSKPAEQAAVQ